MWLYMPLTADRESKYRPCQETTLDTYHDTIMGFMGYLHKYQAYPVSSLALDLYLRPTLMCAFLGYIIARGVGKLWVDKHLTTCGKVAAYINSQQPFNDFLNLQEWLSRLSKQLKVAIPKPSPKALPSASAVWAWVDNLQAQCVMKYKEDMEQ
jgi:hypothetical protein